MAVTPLLPSSIDIFDSASRLIIEQRKEIFLRTQIFLGCLILKKKSLQNESIFNNDRSDFWSCSKNPRERSVATCGKANVIQRRWRRNSMIIDSTKRSGETFLRYYFLAGTKYYTNWHRSPSSTITISFVSSDRVW
jgi:hypothetical protein